ncbi:MAG: Mbeg1-like protein [Bacillota bacterium]
MTNIMDYLDWRGDLDFSRDPLNEVDSLILSILSYNDFEGIVTGPGSKDSISLREAANIFKEQKDISHLEDIPFLNEIPGLLHKAAETERFGNVPLTWYVDQVDPEATKQFAAVVFRLTNKLNFIAFRGTDDSLAGWKEDLQMSFMDEVQSQKEAVKYTERAIMSMRGDFVLGGHSKGGNLSIYAALRMNELNKARITSIYNNDGPGFQPEIVESEAYRSILDRLHTFLPESSIVGMLFEHGKYYDIVKSTGLAITQHNPFIWEVMGNSFILADSLTKESLNINSTIRSWVKKLSKDKKKAFVDAMFDILDETGASSLAELSQEKFSAADAMIKALKTMDPESKVHLKETIELLFDEARSVIKKSIADDFDSLISKRKTRKHKQ